MAAFISSSFLSWLLPAGEGIPVLMYHKVWPGVNDRYAISPERLREHWSYLKNEGFCTLSLPGYLDMVTGRTPVPAKAILLTFDDGYKNNLEFVYPLLKEFGWQATFFIIGNTLDGTNSKENGPDEKMTLADLRQTDPDVVQLAMHGYNHRNMSGLTIGEMEEELAKSLQAATHSGLQVSRVWAYPYGGRPGGGLLGGLKKMMADMGIMAAFRIGNKVSKAPAPDIYELTRIDIRGTDTIRELGIKLRKGKLKPF